MAWTLLLPTSFLLLLLTCCPGSSSQPVVTQEPSLTVSPGGTVTLTCGSSTGAITNGHYPHWFQQRSGQAPRTLIYDTSNKYSWPPSRFSGSLLGAKAALTLAGAQPEDEAEYRCVLCYSVLSTVTDPEEEPRHKPSPALVMWNSHDQTHQFSRQPECGPAIERGKEGSELTPIPASALNWRKYANDLWGTRSGKAKSNYFIIQKEQQMLDQI